jgi:two-component system, LuxR family, response regulator DctR
MQEKLTERERQVLRLMVEGKGNRGIAHLLGSTENTVEAYIKRIFEKLGVSSREELARYVVQSLEHEQTNERGNP